MDITKEFFQNIFPFSEKSFIEFRKIFNQRAIPANEVFIEAGHKNKSEYFILEGFCRSFVFNPEGEEITLSFFKAHDVLSPHIIRTRNDVSLLNYQALTDLEMVEFDADVFLNLMINNLELREFGNNILKNELVEKTEREIALASYTASERLKEFRKEFGILENLIPHPIIASYLGITNVSLSRLRGRAKKN
jgi:CRP-like cAMP-binding protein